MKGLFTFITISLLLTSCTVSFINVGIDYTVLKSFSVEQFDTQAGNAPPTAGQQFSEQLKNKILSNTRLAYQDEEGDIQISGKVSNYQVQSLAPNADQSVSLQRLNITVQVEYVNSKDKSETWQQSFKRFADFDATIDLSTVEDQLIQEVYDQIIEDVFNKAFSGW